MITMACIPLIIQNKDSTRKGWWGFQAAHGPIIAEHCKSPVHQHAYHQPAYHQPAYHAPAPAYHRYKHPKHNCQVPHMFVCLFVTFVQIQTHKYKDKLTCAAQLLYGPVLVHSWKKILSDLSSSALVFTCFNAWPVVNTVMTRKYGPLNEKLRG